MKCVSDIVGCKHKVPTKWRYQRYKPILVTLLRYHCLRTLVLSRLFSRWPRTLHGLSIVYLRTSLWHSTTSSLEPLGDDAQRATAPETFHRNTGDMSSLRNHWDFLQNIEQNGGHTQSRAISSSRPFTLLRHVRCGVCGVCQVKHFQPHQRNESPWW